MEVKDGFYVVAYWNEPGKEMKELAFTKNGYWYTMGTDDPIIPCGVAHYELVAGPFTLEQIESIGEVK